MGRSVATRVAIAALLAGAAAGPAAASVYGDDLGRCLVAAARAADKVVLVKWIFGMMAANPAVQSLAPLSAATRETLNRDAAALTTRLLTQDCRSLAVTAIRYEGNSVIEASFRILGGAATASLMNDPAVRTQIIGYAKGLENPEMKALLAEIGQRAAAKK